MKPSSATDEAKIPLLYRDAEGTWIMLGDNGEQWPIAMHDSPLERAMTAAFFARSETVALDGVDYKRLHAEEIEEFNKGYADYEAGIAYQDIDVGPHDNNCVGWAWAHFNEHFRFDRAARERTPRSATAGFAEAITASVMNASPAARLEACAPFNAAPQATGTGAADASEKQEPAAAAPLSQSDKQYRTWRDDPPQKSTWVWAKYDAEELARLYLTCKRGCCVYSDMGTMILPVLWRPATTAEGEAESERWKSMKHLDVGDLMDAVAPDTSRSSVVANDDPLVLMLKRVEEVLTTRETISSDGGVDYLRVEVSNALKTPRSAIATNDELRNARESRDRWQAEAERIAVLLRAAKCPNSNCERGEIATYDKNGDLDVEPCQWCHERQLYVPPSP